MSTGLILDLARDALWMALLLGGPLLATALVIGLAVSVAQAVTSIQEQTLSFVPKLLAVGGVFLALLSWMLQQMVRYTTELFVALPNLVG